MLYLYSFQRSQLRALPHLLVEVLPGVGAARERIEPVERLQQWCCLQVCCATTPQATNQLTRSSVDEKAGAPYFPSVVYFFR